MEPSSSSARVSNIYLFLLIIVRTDDLSSSVVVYALPRLQCLPTPRKVPLEHIDVLNIECSVVQLI